MIAIRPRRSPADGNALWLDTLRRYFTFAIPAHLVWEVAQLPLYTIWYEDTPGKIAFAVIHCAGGDAMIASISLLGAFSPNQATSAASTFFPGRRNSARS